MPLRTQVVEIPIHQGLNSGVDIRLLQKGLSISRNCVLNRYGNVEKRSGMGHGSNILTATGSSRILSNGKSGYVKNAASSYYKIPKDLAATSVPSLIGSKKILSYVGVSVKAVDNIVRSSATALDFVEHVAINDKEQALVFNDSANSMFYYYDNEVGEEHVATLSPRVVNLVSFGSKPYIFYNDAGDFGCRAYSGATLAAANVIASTLHASCAIDVARVDATSLVVSYIDASSKLVIANMKPSGSDSALAYAITAISASGGSGFTKFNTCWYSSAQSAAFCLAHDKASNKIKYYKLGNIGVASAPTITFGPVDVATTLSANFTACGWANTAYSFMMIAEKVASTKTVDTKVLQYSGSVVNSDNIEMASIWPVTQPNSDGYLWAKCCPYNAGSEPPVDDFGYFLYNLNEMVAEDTKVLFDALGTIYRDRIYYDEKEHYGIRPSNFYGSKVFLPLAFNDAQQDFLVAGAEISETEEYDVNQYDDTLILSTSKPWVIAGEGEDVIPAFFHEYPYAISTTATNAVSAEDFVWQYAAVYKYQYDDGRTIYSRPSPVADIRFSVSAFSATTVKTSWPNTFGRHAVFVQLYRTNKNDNVLRFIDEQQIVFGTHTCTFNDSAADDAERVPKLEFSLTGINGSLLPYDYPMLSCIGTVAFNRYFSVDASKRNRVYYSQDIGYSLGIRMSDDVDFRLAFDVPEDGGEIVALKQVDDKLIIFKERAIYATYGEGRGTTGEGDGYVTPFLVSNSLGCRDRLSVARVPNGLMFMSTSGLKTLTRDLQIDHNGERVRYWLVDADSVPGSLRATEWPGKDSVLWTTDMNLVIYYNYKFDYFSTWKTRSATNGEPRWAALLGDRMFWGLEGGVTFFSDDVYYDKVPLGSTTVIDMAMVTGWMSMNQIGANVRCKNVNVVADNESSVTAHLTLGAQYDMLNKWYDNTVTVANQLNWKDYFTVTGSASVTSFGSYHLSLPRQKCTAIRLKLVESSAKKGFSIQAVSMEVATKEGIRFHSEGKQFS